MTYEELKKARSYIWAKAEADVEELKLAYAKEHQLYKVGDSIMDRIGLIKIESVSYVTSTKPPQAVYRGTQYTLTGRPFKDNRKRNVWQSSINSIKS